uniref:DMT904 n=1 Tax=Arundo donax TaxID=35708 RepID=A0A0A9EYT7_ARUDO
MYEGSSFRDLFQSGSDYTLLSEIPWGSLFPIGRVFICGNPIEGIWVPNQLISHVCSHNLHSFYLHVVSCNIRCNLS